MANFSKLTCIKCGKIMEKSKMKVVDGFPVCNDCFNQTTSKTTNPKDALGIKKAPLHCVPCQPLFELGLAMMEGGRKYGTHNYRDIGVRASVYYDAALRHIMAWWEGEDIDPDSSIHHIVKSIACLFVLRDAMLMDNCEDDRPIKHPKGLNLEEINKTAETLITFYPDCAKPFLEKDKNV